MLPPRLILLFAALTQCQFGSARDAVPVSTWPTVYPGQPSGDYSPAWQTYFKVTEELPGVTFALPNNYAGNIKVQRPNHDNDTLFFWGFEHAEGSLTAAAGENEDAPWAVWLQGGPGSSSLNGVLTENGPINVVVGGETLAKNELAWSNLVDYFWVDNPVGVGFSTSEIDGFAKDQDQIGRDFVGFLRNLVKVFPSLATRPFYITGESYAGRYIPYIVKALFSDPNPPVRLAKMVVGDPAFGSNAEFKTMPTLSLLKTYPQLIGYDTEVYDYFKNQAHLCGLDINLTYPQTGGHFPSINLDPAAHTTTTLSKRGFVEEVAARHAETLARRADHQTRHTGNPARRAHHAEHLAHRAETVVQRHEDRLRKRDIWKRSLSGDTINPQYGCDVWDEMVDYATNFTFPWTTGSFYSFDIPNAMHPRAKDDPTFFFTDPKVVAALHAPQLVQWTSKIDYPWNSKSKGGDPSPEPMTFFTELATNATKHNVAIVTYVGNDDAISGHFGTQVTIQNTTFGGTQGFTRQPSTPWWDDSGNFGGIVHQERNWTYALVVGAGHEVPAGNPGAAYTFFHKFILLSSPTGLLLPNGTVVGGENPTLAQDVLPGQDAIFFGSRSVLGSTAWPEETVAAFRSHVGILSVTGTDKGGARETGGP